MMFVIEHLDPKVWHWSLLEYKHISSLVGKKKLLFSNVHSGASQLRSLGSVESKSVTKLKLQRVCILDSTGKRTLASSDAQKFDYFVFGGILGDYPEVDKSLKIVKGLPRATVRNLGKHQMSTDTAVLVAKRILDGERMQDIPFIDEVELKRSSEESVILPFRYVLRHGKPVLAPGLKQMLLTQKGF